MQFLKSKTARNQKNYGTPKDQGKRYRQIDRNKNQKEHVTNRGNKKNVTVEIHETEKNFIVNTRSAVTMMPPHKKIIKGPENFTDNKKIPRP